MRKLFIICLLLSISQLYAQQTNVDVVIYGATPSGIFAAINAAREGHSVALVEEYKHIGGLMTGGLSFTDFRSLESLSGTFNEYRNRVLTYYKNKYGQNAKQIADSYQGVDAEPHVTLMIFKQLLAEQPSIRIFTQHRIVKATVAKNSQRISKIQSVTFTDLTNGQAVIMTGKVFIDATYEGDLAVAAGAEYRIGRESRNEYCERYAGHIFYKAGQILAEGTGEGDQKIQAYNFRVIMTDSAANRRMIEKPANYDRNEFLPIANVFANGKVQKIFTETPDGILRVQPLVNRKADINDIKNAPVRMSSLGKNYDYPNGSPEVRKRIIEQHREHILGMIYFLQNDESIPLAARKEALEWGLAKDEFADNDLFPYRLYIREARRIMGDVVFTERNVDQATNSIRSVLNPNAIAICDYSLNCHGVSAPGPIYADMTEGDFNYTPQPFQIPYGVMLPKKFDNLLVSVAISSSHVGFCGIRLEPTWSALGQAAGLAAHLSLKKGISVTKVNVAELQSGLIKKGAKIIYVSDVEAESPYFEAVQYYGSKGFFHDLYAPEDVNLIPLKVLKLQYRNASLYHNIDPEKSLDPALAARWIKKLPLKDQAPTTQFYQSKSWKRGEFLNALYAKNKS
ncbi:FAD-dependent oxidoreductase [Runella sp.]|uniref:FAD-dependent oxidoreductase n=1 Tax=Runella sp. TaxID=1960881 RepID=UPI003D125C3B